MDAMSTPERLEQMFAPFGLRITCGPLALRSVREADVPDIADAINRHGIYDDGRPFPFLDRWAENLGAHGLPTAQFYWRLWAGWSVSNWHLVLRVEHEGRLVGVQDVMARDFPDTRSLGTGSWLLRSEQGRGIGTLMRQAVCAFGFDELGAEQMTSSAFVGNAASQAVSRKVGYRENGVRRARAVDGGVRLTQDFALSPDDFVRPPFPVECTGVEEFRRSIGLEPHDPRRLLDA